MKVKFKRPIRIDGVSYQPGVSQVDDSLEKHWFFQSVLKDGHAEISEPPMVPEIKADEPEVIEEKPKKQKKESKPKE